MGELVYITEISDILQQTKGLTITGIIKKEIPCNCNEVVIQLSNGNSLKVDDALRVVYEEGC